MYLQRLLFVIFIVLHAGVLRAAEPKPIKALLVIGGCCHDYNRQKDLLVQGLTQRAHLEISVSYDPDKSTAHLNPIFDKESWADSYDVIIHDECSSDVKDLKSIERILAPHKKGLPAVLLHCAMHCYRSEGYPEVTPWFELTGVQSTGHGPHKPIDIVFHSTKSAITEGLSNWTTINEELYNNSSGKLLETASALAIGKQLVPNKDGGNDLAEAVVVWTNLYQNKTRVFATTIGHASDTVADGRYLDLVTRGLLWSCDKLQPAYLKN